MAQTNTAPTLELGCSEPELFLDAARPGFFAVWWRDPAAGAERRAAMLAAGIDPKRVARIGDGFQRVYPLSKLTHVIAQCQGKADRYVSQLTFRQPKRKDGSPGIPNRRKTNASGAKVCFLDFDIGIRRDQVDDALARLLDEMSAANLPIPSYAVYSGRGLHLKWLLTREIPKSALKRWDLVERALLQAFLDRHWAVDRKAIDRSRVLRIPGSVNSKSGTTCEVVWINWSQTAEVHRYDFDVLADSVLPLPRAAYLAKVQTEYLERGKEFEAARKSRKAKYKLRGLEIEAEKAARNVSRAEKKSDGDEPRVKQKRNGNPRRLAYDRAADCLKLLSLRAAVPATASADRESTIFWCVTFEALSGRIDSRNLADRAREIARSHCPPEWAIRHESRWESQLSTVGKRFGAWRAGKPDLVYTPRNTTLIDSLRISADEQMSLKTIISPKEKERRRTLQRRSEGIVEREEYLATVKAKSTERAKPWLAENVSRATWYRRRADA